MLGMVIPDITNPFFPLIVRGAEDAALAQGYLLVTFNTDDRVEREEQVLATLRMRRVDGILLVVAPNAAKAAHIEGVVSAGIPIVCLDRVPKGLAVDSVTVDNVRGTEMCVRHLIQMGHTRIGMICGALELQNSRDRLRGYENAFREKGLPLAPELIREGHFRSQSGYRMSKELCLTADGPTAIFVSNGMMALGLPRSLKELAIRVPRRHRSRGIRWRAGRRSLPS
jgi:LacI family transcriptional regulator